MSDGRTLYWWVEVILVATLDLAYESIRNASKSRPEIAYRNALRIIDWQNAMRINHEKAVQDWSLNYVPVIVFSNYFYGSAYIAVTVAALVFLYRRFPDDYPLWRNTLGVGTFIGLIGFATFPLMPPRLLDTQGGYEVFGFIDTLVRYPTFWSFDSPTMQSISNQFAAMPSLHCGWALWGAMALWPRVRSWWAKTLTILYPVMTVYVIVATANHYFLDAIGGFAIFLVGYAVASTFTRSGRQRRQVGEWYRAVAETSTDDPLSLPKPPRALRKPL